MAGTTISSTAVNDDFSDIATALTGSVSADGQTPITNPLQGTSGTASLPSWTFTADHTSGMYLAAVGKLGFAGNGVAIGFLDQNLAATTGNQFYYANGAIPCPVGSIKDWPGVTAPTGWLFLYGQVVSQTTYAGLFAVCSTTYNTGGEGAGNFRLPDCRGRLTAGKDNMGGSTAGNITNAGCGVVGTTLGATGGSQNQTIDTTQIPAHNHVAASVVTDPGHIHAVTDPGHSHTIGTNATGTAVGAQTVNNTVAGGTPTTGINNAVTGISINSHATGITVATTTSNTGGGLPLTTMPPIVIFNKIIFAGL